MVVANIVLHYVLDEWFAKEVRPRLKGLIFGHIFFQT